jgi:hypothetical protein
LTTPWTLSPVSAEGLRCTFATRRELHSREWKPDFHTAARICGQRSEGAADLLGPLSHRRQTYPGMPGRRLAPVVRDRDRHRIVGVSDLDLCLP